MKPVILYDEKDYYILLGKDCKSGIYLPLLIDLISRNRIGSCIDSNNIGTLFLSRESAIHAKDLLMDRYSDIKMAQLKIIGHFVRE